MSSDASRKSPNGKGRIRPREEKRSDELVLSPWMVEVWKALGFDAEEESRKPGVWKDARSKTLTFDYVDELDKKSKVGQKPRTLSSRQYVLHCSRTDPAVKDYEEKISPELMNMRYEEIGFWKAHTWSNQVLVLVDGGKSKREGKSDLEITSFIIVALATIPLSGEKPEITTDKNQIYAQIQSLLSNDQNDSDPPEIQYLSEKGPKSEVVFLYEKAKRTWEQLFTKNVSVVTKERFQVVTHLNQESFDKLTRLQHVVEREDWFKICMFLLCSLDPEAIGNDTREMDEAVELVKKKVLHFSLMTMVDDYSLSNTETGVDIIPAFRLWRYSFYMLFIRDSSQNVRRFYLCKHHKGDHFMFQYNPYTDHVTAFQITSEPDVNKVFFYIVPIEGVPCDPIPTFNSLTEVYNELRSSAPNPVTSEASA